MAQEIERKFLVELPDLGSLDVRRKICITQTYLNRGENNEQRRVRRISENGTAVLMATHNYTLMQKYPSRIANCKNGTVVCSDME